MILVLFLVNYQDSVQCLISFLSASFFNSLIFIEEHNRNIVLWLFYAIPVANVFFYRYITFLDLSIHEFHVMYVLCAIV